MEGQRDVMSVAAIVLAADHGGVEMKNQIRSMLEAGGMPLLDLGTHDGQSVNYPDYAVRLAQALKDGSASRGLLFCGSGIGMSIVANRFSHIRAALIHDAYGARYARLHNDANVLVMGGRTTGIEVAKDCVRIFLSTEFEGGRHADRVATMAQYGS